MWRLSRSLRSNSLHNPGPFLDGALQLIKLHLAHKNAAADKNTKACSDIEGEFLRELEAFRACFTMSSSLKVAKLYTKKLHGALSYFQLYDDPLMRQLDMIIGKQTMQPSAGRQHGVFKAPVAARLDPFFLDEREETVLPSELPNPPKPDPSTPLRERALKVPAQHRGHWVLRDPDIAITREERRTDPW
ncbi:hypothetical protein, conserved [Trypanosoma brucei gambiense DAL972]|uniref:Uncharacterized protein n=2 Tax=Trypanosoma brucei TaxID=5691 RepID=C9ZQM3_TRYB9|nr:hypothetical protein, conserved [Trypanosoma brucei gambiense DAL972]6SG9_FY Chain FY, mt-SAF28 [Trypanosoma brucei brucei]6SGA_FY Chain FY, mt-SAF28 [Trypanosoma brucei brucei]6SGB_FY Chain FY, mt-SAF28 [Trypanosoma brucei brucei]RHW71949.1 hypothetical protein DPX39_060023800 [Trypanosoma brucei equiperdum]CBH11703.1 hypothetical protein, conserved [Trypanosoma brucei gambiense DAL972]|eukprot:XP_011773988.1 hypothetical protein, conserved [Trypanosoma brucei gambiense DAL972]